MEKEMRKASGSTFLRYLSGIFNPMGLILSVAVVWGLSALFQSMFGGTLEEGLTLSLTLYLFMLLFYTNIKFAIDNHKMGYRKMDMESEIGRICAEVNQEAHELSHRVPKNIKFYVNPKDNDLNAYCFGSRKVCVSQGFANSMRPSQGTTQLQSDNLKEIAKGILAHEFGHVADGDMIGEHFCVAAMATLGAVLYVAYLFLYVIVKVFASVPIFCYLAVPLSYLLNGLYKLVNWLTGLGYRLYHIIGGKRQETNADAFAVKLGHKAGLLAFLNVLQEAYGDGKVLDEHPLTSKRIAALEKIEG